MSAERRAALQAKVAERELDALLVTNLVNVRWLTGFDGSNAAVVLGASQLRFITDFRYLTQSAEQLDAEWEREIATDLLKRAVEGLPAEPLKLGFDDTHLTVRQHAQLRQARRRARGRARRRRRDRRGAARGQGRRRDRADPRRGEGRRRGLRGGRRRRDRRPHGARRRARPRDRDAPPRRARGRVCADRRRRRARRAPARRAARRPIPAGTLVVIDWGAQLDGYASDCTRTVATGELDPRDEEIYETVLVAQEAALRAVRAGPTGKEIDAVARAIIDDAGHAEHFGHGLGHGVGMEVHEGPRLGRPARTRWRQATSSPSSRASTCRARSACGSRISSRSRPTGARCSTGCPRRCARSSRSRPR